MVCYLQRLDDLANGVGRNWVERCSVGRNCDIVEVERMSRSMVGWQDNLIVIAPWQVSHWQVMITARCEPMGCFDVM